MRIGGVDPSILRELSGGYKPFVKALNELLSNAYDADADLVQIRLGDDFSSIEIEDNGVGMTLFEFRSDFTRLGGSIKKTARGVTPKGRPRIGSKGIGFLAVARYCSSMKILSTTLRNHRGKIQHKGYATKIDLAALLEVPIPQRLLFGRLKITSVTILNGVKKKRLRSSDFTLAPNGIVLILKPKIRVTSSSIVEIGYSLNCRDLEFNAVINYDYLLSLENKKDLSRLSDFCKVEVKAFEANDPRIKQHYTKITLSGLKGFIVRDLKSAKRTGHVRNLDSESGLERFLWHLSRSAPLRYQLPEPIADWHANASLDSPRIKAIDRVVFSGPDYRELELRRPLWSMQPLHLGTDEVFLPVTIDEAGLKARGYIKGYSEAIFPAEYRGIAVRVRNVQIGSPGFLGLGRRISGAARAMLSQVTGEINVIEGLDATDALNPGRDSFYEENHDYKILRRHLIGDDEGSTGLVGCLIEQMLARIQVRSAVQNQLSRADNYRAALLNLSMAINHYGISDAGNVDLKGFFGSSSDVANGLSHCHDYEMLPGPRLGDFRVTTLSSLEQAHSIDFQSQTVYFNYDQERWSRRIFVLGHYYDVLPKAGTEDDPLCEIDTADKKVYVNWGHPLRQQMGDVAFLKTAIALKLSYHASRGNIEVMMDLALKLQTYNT